MCVVCVCVPCVRTGEVFGLPSKRLVHAQCHAHPHMLTRACSSSIRARQGSQHMTIKITVSVEDKFGLKAAPAVINAYVKARPIAQAQLCVALSTQHACAVATCHAFDGAGRLTRTRGHKSASTAKPSSSLRLAPAPTAPITFTAGGGTNVLWAHYEPAGFGTVDEALHYRRRQAHVGRLWLVGQLWHARLPKRCDHGKTHRVSVTIG